MFGHQDDQQNGNNQDGQAQFQSGQDAWQPPTASPSDNNAAAPAFDPGARSYLGGDSGAAPAQPVDQPTPAAPADQPYDQPAPAAPDPQPADQPAPAPAANNDLLDIKQQALGQLSPIVDHLDQSPEEKFRTTMMMIQATDNHALVKDAYAAAQAIPDEKAKAQALLDVINEINYFTQHSA